MGKFAVGVGCHSTALIADAGHSLSDLFSDFITLCAVHIGRLPPDDDHPDGHAKFEAIGSLFLSLILMATGFGVGASSTANLIEVLTRTTTTAAATLPGVSALVMAGLSVVSKEWLFRITHRVGTKLNSPVVVANAWHHRSDAYSSILALFSIALARMGWLAADAAAGIMVAFMIGMTGVEILGDSIQQLTTEPDDHVTELSDTGEAQVNQSVRQDVALRHPNVEVQGVTVHPIEDQPNLVDIDIDICVYPDEVYRAPSIALGLKQTLQRSPQIQTARVFLDLNHAHHGSEFDVLQRGQTLFQSSDLPWAGILDSSKGLHMDLL